jgi:hypothetical protein
MFIAPLWIIKDLSVKKKSFFDFYKSVEQKTNKPLITILIVSIVLINWVWNITKHL